MRNVHLITKEQEGADVLHQYLYITSEEEIKGDWFLRKGKIHKSRYNDGNGNLWTKNGLKIYASGSKKIILTTDPDLIAEGVQPIDNEFLEWFVKNPSCEFVDAKKGFADGTAWGYNFLDYKIIIPQEEPKQIKCYCGHTITCDCEPLQERLEEPTEEAKQRAENYMSLKGALEPLQETIEEAAERLYPIRLMYFPMKAVDLNEEPRNIFNNGAKLQAERMYSEEDMIAFATFYYTHQGKATEYWGKDLFKVWLEKFKKK
jgi:hypothetical protein